LSDQRSSSESYRDGESVVDQTTLGCRRLARGYDAAMRVARWRWMLVPMVIVVAGCLPQPPPALPPSFLSQYSGASGPTFTVQTPPIGETGQDIVGPLWALRARDNSPMFRGRAIPVFGVIDCHGVPDCTWAGGGPAQTVWVVLYPDCTDAAGDFGWALVDG
jgi:hypothetical protein